MDQAINVINLRGETEPFSQNKVYHSALRAGADHKLAKQIADQIESQALDGMKTSQIYTQVQDLLKQNHPHAAIRFKLKEAIRKLGPSGFPFEKFVAQILTEHGWRVKINQFISGACIDNYEIDFTANKNNALIIGECKFRNNPKDRINLEKVLANQARFEDITQKYKTNKKLTSLLVTNTKFTLLAKKYCACKKTDLLGWHYPQDKGLENLIEEKNLYPITILPSVNKVVLQGFCQVQIMLVKQLLDLGLIKVHQQTGIDKNLLKKLLEEAKTLLD